MPAATKSSAVPKHGERRDEEGRGGWNRAVPVLLSWAPPPRLLGDTRFPLTAARKEEQKYKRPRYSINNETRTR